VGFFSDNHPLYFITDIACVMNKIVTIHLFST